ncbi:anthranilate phosphoribosyltransferase [Actinokineospora alba]|uniref:Anthranilate phosphoribosyltransferase n=1 Tax=Actinokineospora alba TaxID=504798 RepID=A0A1H0JPJ5_9PSEU|nr:anthranilate phosphoribosyltransferase [Actinokineospora alba]TDP68219.1 anthranilate phosphoribosyltransferase [Actinokineospora alba]SDH94533.1 anthranilate phosphoribosyltransferase [Actinokineospora alba]SDO45494.1 anthranilate phosphoribosyltransferase [Actinokineospora alba]
MTARTWPRLLNQLIDGVDLAAEDTTWAMNEIMSGSATPSQIAGFAIGLRAKGETAAEIAGMAEGMLAHAKLVHVGGNAVDVVGTGGDQAHTVNISTMSALVTAAAGVPVAKHGNRSASSQCGTADVLEELGVAIELSPDAVATCVREVGIGFCFAPAFHPALRFAGPTRRELGVPTAFNVLGPLTNPAQPTAGLVGCANARMAPIVAEVFARRGASVLVVRGDDNLDEITTTTTTSVWVVSGGKVREDRIDPAKLGVTAAEPQDLRGGDAAFNAQVIRDLVAGKSGPVRDAVVLNAAGAIAAFRGLSADVHADLEAALGQATLALDSGAASTLLDRWTVRSTELAG